MKNEGVDDGGSGKMCNDEGYFSVSPLGIQV